MKYALVVFNGGCKEYCFMYDESDGKLEAGDIVVTASKSNYDLAVVIDADYYPSDVNMITAWIVQKVDVAKHLKRVEAIKKKKAMEAIFEHRKRVLDKRKEYRELADVDQVTKDLIDEYNEIITRFDL